MVRIRQHVVACFAVVIICSICSLSFMYDSSYRRANIKAIRNRILLQQNDDMDPILDFNIPSDDDDEEEVDINLVADTIIDQSIERTVKQMLSDPPKLEETSPVEKFQNIYNNIKNRSRGNNNYTVDAALMLAELFPAVSLIEPFDERKIFTQLRQSLDKEDFEEVFRDPVIGDFL